MNRERIGTCLTGAALACLISVGAVGCLLTGFELNTEHRQRLWLVCCLWALLCSGACRWRWGSAAMAGLLALSVLWLWYRSTLQEQLLQLIARISYVYHRAYGWSYLQNGGQPWNAGHADLPLQLIGCITAAAVSHGVCRGKRTWPAVVTAAVPLALCLVVTNTVPRERFLYCLLLGLVLLVLTSALRQTDRHQAARLAVLLALPAALSLALLFRAIPRENYVNQAGEVRDRILSWAQSLPEQAEEAARDVAVTLSGAAGETVDLKRLGPRSQQDYPVLEVTCDPGGRVYLRRQDYDGYTGTGWTSADRRSETFSPAGGPSGTLQIRTRTVWKERVTAYHPGQAVTLVGGSLANDAGEKEYTQSLQLLPENWRSLVRDRSGGHWESREAFDAAMEAADALDAQRYLQLPRQTRIRGEQLLQQQLIGGETATEQADAIAALVRAGARYDRDPQRMPSGEEDFALWFLEQADRGYCVHFATAAAVLLRCAGIPARYVTGYVVQCPPGGTVTVTADMAHAWVEYYEPQLACWIPLEATPAEGLPTAAGEDAEPVQTEEIPETVPAQSGPGEAAGSAPADGGDREDPAQERKDRTRPLRWLLLPVTAAAAVLQSRFRLALRRRRRTGTPNRRALGCWREAELLAKLCRQRPPGDLEQLALKAKFSQHTLTEQELAKMQAYIDSATQRLKQRPWYRRLVYRLIHAAW